VRRARFSVEGSKIAAMMATGGPFQGRRRVFAVAAAILVCAFAALCLVSSSEHIRCTVFGLHGCDSSPAALESVDGWRGEGSTAAAAGSDDQHLTPGAQRALERLVGLLLKTRDSNSAGSSSRGRGRAGAGQGNLENVVVREVRNAGDAESPGNIARLKVELKRGENVGSLRSIPRSRSSRFYHVPPARRHAIMTLTPSDAETTTAGGARA
jgi:hypothetical protein